MGRTLRFVVGLIAVAALAAWMADHPGRVTLFWQEWRIDTSVALLALAVAAVAAATAVVYRFWLFLRRTPASLRRALKERRRRKGYLALTQGMVAVAAGDAKEARKQAGRADVLLGDPALTLLLSAQAAQLGGDERAAERFFLAMRDRPETAFLGLRGLLNQAVKKGDRDGALRLARQAHRLRPDSAWVETQLLTLETETGRWTDAQQTLRHAIKKSIVERGRGRHLDGVLDYLRGVDAEARGDASAARDLIGRALKRAPDLVPATVALARLQAAAGKTRRAVATLERGWLAHPHPEIAVAYRMLRNPAHALAAVQTIQRLVRRNPEATESRFAVAQAALDAELWGEARKQLQPLLEGTPSARVCRLMARVEDAERQDRAASHDWLTRASLAPADPVWQCGECRMTAPGWSARCGHCGGFATLRWRTPASAALLAPAPPAAV